MLERDIVPGSKYVIIQNNKFFKYGVDGIILSRFEDIKKGRSVLEIGSGTGIIPLRLASFYSPKIIYTVEIQKELCELFSKTIELNNLEDIIKLENIDINEYHPKEKLDYIITNPPYRELDRGIYKKDQAFNTAFEGSLKLEDIFVFSEKYLKEKGILIMINSINRLVDVMELGRKHRLEPFKLRFIHSERGKNAYAFMASLRRLSGKNLVTLPALYLYENGKITDEVKEIYYGIWFICSGCSYRKLKRHYN